MTTRQPIEPAAFKAAVAVAALRREQSLPELAERFGVTLEQIQQWESELVEASADAFAARDNSKQADGSFLDNKQLALTIAENSTQGFAMMDERGYCIYANRAWLQMTGFSVEEIGSKQLHHLVHHHFPDGRHYPMSECPIDRALPQNISVRAHEDLFFRKDGSTFPVMCAASPIFENGRAVATVIEIRDITQQKRAAGQERQLVSEALASAEANAKFRTFFEQGSNFAAVVTLDGTVIEANRLCVEGTGFARNDVIGKKFWDCGWWSPSSELVQMVQTGWRQASESQQFRRETPYFVGDGSQRIVELVLTPVLDNDGRVLFIAPTGTDITDRKQAENRLRLLDEISISTRSASDPTTIMEVTTRLLGQQMDVTRCAYADLEPDNDRFTIRHDWNSEGAASSVGVYSLDLFGPRAAADMRTGRTLIVRDVDQELEPLDGRDMFNAIGVKAIICFPLVKQGHLVAMMAVHQNAPRSWTGDNVALVGEVVERSWGHIERVRAVEALREADRRKTEFLAILAHELRNPLAPIRNGLDLMRGSNANPGIVTKVVEMMERQINQMVHLIDDLLDLARINRGTVQLKKQRSELKDMVASAVEMTLPLIETTRHELRLDIPETPLLLDADPVRITQIVSNLLSNAAKYSPRESRITLSVKKDGTDIVLSVADNGIGIEAESLSAVFEMFTQTTQARNHAQGGLGIGLSIVRKLVELHGGQINVASPGIGSGSTFTVRLPLALDGAATNREDVMEKVMEGDDNPRHFRILVVDDNVDAAVTTATLLNMVGHTTEVANNGAEGLRRAREFRPHIVFLDIGMPDMDGYEVARLMRKTPETEKILLVALSGWGSDDALLKARQAGFDQHLTKPAQFSTIQYLLTRISQLKQHTPLE